jgi:large subunit ribosomal protein L25
MANTPEGIVIAVERREPRGSNAARRLRARGLVPGNVYGLDRDPFAVAVDPARIEQVLRLGSGRNTIFSLALEQGQQSRAVMLRELQRDPVSERLVHVDFVRFDPNRTIHVKVPVRLVGIPTGVKNEGGVVDFVHREVEVECLPAAIPEHLDVDVSELHVNQNVSVADLELEPGVKVLDAPDMILAVVSEPRKEEVPAAAEAAAVPAEGAPPAAEAGAEAKKEEGEGA